MCILRATEKDVVALKARHLLETSLVKQNQGTVRNIKMKEKIAAHQLENQIEEL